MFNERNPTAGILATDVRNIAGRLGLIGDDRYGFWSNVATEAHGQLDPYWRFTDMGCEEINSFLDHYMAQSEPLITGGSCKNKNDVISYLLRQAEPIGKGTYLTLKKDKARDSMLNN